jgi:hypothetical protein
MNRITPFLIQVILTLSLVSFSILQVTVNPNKDNSVYFSLIGSVSGFWFPSPKKEDK